MTRAEKIEVIRLLEEKVRRLKYQAITRYFPDTGPLRRELYPKHLEFFKAGVEHRERLMCAANRVGKCITIDSMVETPNGPQPLRELIGKPFDVIAWNGTERVVARASAPFKKTGIHPCYRLTLANGEWIECADHHRFLCADGWRLLSECLPAIFQSLPATIGESFQSVRDEDARDLTGIPSSSKGHCSVDSHQHDEQPHFSEDSDRERFPSRDDVRPRNDSWLHRDGLSTISSDSPSLPLLPPAMRDGQRHLGDQYAVSETPYACKSAAALSGPCQESLQHDAVASFDPQSAPSLAPQRLPHKASYPCPVLLNATNRIVSVTYIGRKEVYDFTVEIWHNYVAANMISHNSESVGGYETTLHLTGRYPDWWPGRRFSRPVSWWASGDTGKTTRDIIQYKLLGPIHDIGSGLIPKESIIQTTRKAGVADAIETISVRHVSGGMSEIGLKSYDQRREAFQGTEKDGIWLDEEPPLDVYVECILRTMTNDGMIILTFTPLQGISDVVLSFMPNGAMPDQVPV